MLHIYWCSNIRLDFPVWACMQNNKQARDQVIKIYPKFQIKDWALLMQADAWWRGGGDGLTNIEGDVIWFNNREPECVVQ